MLTWIKLISTAALFFVSIRNGNAGAACLLLSVAALAAITGPGLAELARKNIFIVVFALSYFFLAVVSGYAGGTIDCPEIARNSINIILAFNLFYLGSRWIGRDGLYRLIAASPSLRIKMFFIVFGGLFQSIARSHRSMLSHLRSRVDLRTERLRIARYYTQNLIEKEFYAYRNYQATFLTRLTEEPTLVWDGETFAIRQLLPALFMTILCVIMILTRLKGMLP